MILNTGLNKISIPNQTSCELEISLYNISNKNSGFIGLSGNSFAGFKIFNGVILDSNDNFITSLGYGDTLNLRCLFYTGESVIFSDNEILSHNTTINPSGYQYLTYQLNESVEGNVNILGLKPKLSASLLNNFSGTGSTVLTGYINNSETLVNFQITGLEVLSPTVYYVDSFNSGIINNSGQFTVKHYFPDIPYDRSNILLKAETNFGNINFQLDHSPYNDFGKFNVLNVSPILPSNIGVGEFKTFTLNSRFNWPISNKNIDVSFEVVSGGQPMSYYDYFTVPGSGICTGSITGSGDVSGYMSGSLSGSGFSILTGIPFVKTGFLTGVTTGDISGQFGFSPINIESYEINHSGTATSGSLGIVTGGVKVFNISGLLSYSHLTDVFSGDSVGIDSATITGFSNSDAVSPLESYDAYFGIGLPTTVAVLDSISLDGTLTYDQITPANANQSFSITSSNYSGYDGSSFWYTGLITGFFTGNVGYYQRFYNSVSGSWTAYLYSNNNITTLDTYLASSYKLLILKPKIALNTSGEILSDNSYEPSNSVLGLDSSERVLVKKSFSYTHNINTNQSSDVNFQFTVGTGFNFTGCFLHSYLISGTGVNSYYPTSGLNQFGEFEITNLKNFSGSVFRANKRLGVNELVGYTYTGSFPGIFNNTNVSGKHILSFKKYYPTNLEVQSLDSIRFVECSLKRGTASFNYSIGFTGNVNPITGIENFTGIRYHNIVSGVFREPSVIPPNQFFNIKTGKSELSLIDFNYNGFYNSTGFINSGSQFIAKPIQFNRSFIRVYNIGTGLSGFNVLKINAHDGSTGIEYYITGDT